ncbi:MAG: hypothetical protein JXB49_29340 [Bacteroidales bacterium]|nr:hypothetical protein [Bacteroidales bacterium]
MKKLEKLNISPIKVLSDGELVKLKGGITLACNCDGYLPGGGGWFYVSAPSQAEAIYMATIKCGHYPGWCQQG